MIAVIFVLVVFVLTAVIFFALPLIRERDEIKRKEKYWSEINDESEIFK